MKDVVLRGVSHAYREAGTGRAVPALDGVSLDIAAGELVALLGPSGCGKTTILHLVAGIFRPDTGEVRCGGRPIERIGPDRVLVFQDGALFPWLTVAENIAFGARGRPVGPLVDALGLSGAERRYPKELSGGMRQRVALARALAAEPDVLLLDEPFAALDAISREQLQDVLLDVWSTRRTTALLVTHSVDEALRLADRVVVLSARPAQVREIVRVDVPRPRDPAALVALGQRLRALIAVSASGPRRGS